MGSDHCLSFLLCQKISGFFTNDQYFTSELSHSAVMTKVPFKILIIFF